MINKKNIPETLDFLSSLKIAILILISMPFWLLPLMSAFIIKTVQYKADKNISLIYYFSLVPIIYAYGTMLMEFVSIQKDKVHGKLKTYSFVIILKRHAKSFARLAILQTVDIFINKFSPAGFLFGVSMFVYYFSAEITEYFYRRIMQSIPVNKRMLAIWGKK